MTIDEIIAQTKHDIELAEAATPGPWQYARGRGIIAFSKDEDKQHCANSRTAVPRLGRMLLAAIEMCRELGGMEATGEARTILDVTQRAAEGEKEKP